MRINFKNFGLLQALVLLSLMYVVGMLIWTASTRPAVEAKANLVKENHKKVVDFLKEFRNIYYNTYYQLIDILNTQINFQRIFQLVLVFLIFEVCLIL